MTRPSIGQGQPEGPGSPAQGDGSVGKSIDSADRTVVQAPVRKERIDGAAMLAALAIIVILGASTLWMDKRQPDAARTTDPQELMRQFDTVPFALPEIPVISGMDGQQPESGEPALSELAAPPLSPVLARPPGNAGTDPAAPRANPNASPALVFDSGADVGSGMVVSGGSAADIAPQSSPPGANTAPDAGRTLTRGTLIPAVLETAIDTKTPGYVRAVVSADVRSFDGRHMLVPRSSRLVGQYWSEMSGGQTRAYVIWTTLNRPDGTSVATGPSQSAEGQFMRRFAAASMTSVIGSPANLPDRVRQGEPIRVMTARDVDVASGH